MAPRYNPGQVKEYWQESWAEAGVYELPADVENPTYVLGMFPYTSGALHMGHVRNYAITDAYARYRRMVGDDVLHPMGWDAFGLPAENAAHERDTDPETWTRTCIARMRAELEEMGFGYDWSREITTCDPEYYRWNQWLFKRLYEADLVTYESAAVNWCPDCETVLADAQVEPPSSGDATGDGDTRDDTAHEREQGRSHGRGGGHGHGLGAGVDGVCWRCETPVEARDLPQWFFTITDYAEELHASLDDLDGWPDGVRERQRNWIGRQPGARVTFDVPEYGDVDAFTARLDTVHGATFLAVSPGHDLATSLASEDEAVAEFVAEMDETADAEGTAGVDTGVTAVHPLTGDEVPVYVAAYVLEAVGTGAVMGVPAHDERDHAFAVAHDLPVEAVVEPSDGSDTGLPDEPFTDDGRLRVRGPYEGVASAAAREELLAEEGIGRHVTYRLRDWLISRQRYWGTPIPVVHCEDCGRVLVPDENLPVELPEFVRTTGNPLAENRAFVETTCPECGKPAERETDTMDTFVDSSWYFLRYLSPGSEAPRASETASGGTASRDDAPFDADRADDWLPVDVYVGGDEHSTLHLLYIRFFTRALADIGLLSVREPVERLVTQGTVLHSGEKMSKSKGNVVAPHEYGAETTRLFVLAAAHPTQDFEWTAKRVRRAYDLQQTLYSLVIEFVTRDDEALREAPTDHDTYLEQEIDRTIAAITENYERFRYHRVVSEIEQFARLLRRYRAHETPHRATYVRALRTLTALVAPIAPYLAEEMWVALGERGLAAEADWPAPLGDVADHRLERRLVQATLEDVRDITDVVDIEASERIELVVAPEWKYRVYERVREAAPDGAVVGRVMDDETVAAHGEAAADFAADLAARRDALEPVLDGERAFEVLDHAAWLFADEFGANVTVRRATADTDDLGAKAEPGKPAIHIS